MQKVMITGAGGFLGRHLCKMLESDGYEVVRFYHGGLDILPEAKALRLTWMCQPYDAEHPHQDYVSNMLSAKAEGRQMKSSALEHRGVTDVRTVCGNLVGIFGRLPGGVYNFGAGNLNDSYTTMLHLAAVAGYPEENVIKDTSWGRNLAMDCSKIAAFGIAFPATEDSVSGCLVL